MRWFILFYCTVLSQVNVPSIGKLDDFPCFPTRYSAYKFRSGDHKVIPVVFSDGIGAGRVDYYVVSGDFYRAVKRYNNIKVGGLFS